MESVYAKMVSLWRQFCVVITGMCSPLIQGFLVRWNGFIFYSVPRILRIIVPCYGASFGCASWNSLSKLYPLLVSWFVFPPPNVRYTVTVCPIAWKQRFFVMKINRIGRPYVTQWYQLSKANRGMDYICDTCFHNCFFWYFFSVFFGT